MGRYARYTRYKRYARYRDTAMTTGRVVVVLLLATCGDVAMVRSQQYGDDRVDELDLEVSRVSGALVKDVKQINLYLNIPDNCQQIYNGLIDQLSSCRDARPGEGDGRGHPRLKKGCLLRMDFSK